MRAFLVRFFCLFVFLLPLAACGLQPVYGTRTPSPAAATEEQLRTIDITLIADREGQKLRNYLIDHMHGEGALTPQYRLNVGLQFTRTDLGIRKDDTATRSQLRIGANFQLIDLKTGQPVHNGSIRSLVSYNILISQYGTLVNEKDARDRGLRDVGQEIVNRLSLYFSRKNNS